jgi:mono/diheme cytochrome c family protein
MKRIVHVSSSLLAISLILIACSSLKQNASPLQSPPDGSGMPMGAPGMGGQGGVPSTSMPAGPSGSENPVVPASPQATLSPAADPGNGEQIYFTAADKNGSRIRYTGGPNFGAMMMGSYLTCAACHGPDAHGGRHVMHMQTMDAPPVYYAALTSMLAEESGGTQQPGGYSLDDFRKAVVDGQHPDGDKLDNDMPRWQMSDQDLADVFAFLKTIPQ